MPAGPDTDTIYRELEQELVTLHIRPNALLSENQLCKRFGVSRTPIRSALQRLEQNRFVRIIPHRGTIVTTIDLQTASQMVYQRVAVESMVLRDFIKTATPLQVEQVRYSLQQLEAVSDVGDDPAAFDHTTFLHYDLGMHEQWFRATDKMFLWGWLLKPQADYSRLMQLDIIGAQNVPDVLVDHREMMDVIDRGAAEEVEPLMMRHLYGGMRRLGAKMFSEEYREYFQSSL